MQLSFKEHSDESLISIFCIQENTEGLALLYQRYAHLVYGVCMKYLKHADDAKDATMQIFEKLITDVCKYDILLFKAWIYKVAKNHCLMMLRKNPHKTKLVADFEEAGMEIEDNLHPTGGNKEELLTKMEEAMKDLNEDQRRCITLFYLEKKTYIDIMEITGFNFMQVKSFIQNGKRNLKMKVNQNMTNE